jgi:hypothetical protein
MSRKVPAWKATEATRPISELAAQAADGLSREAPSLTAVSYLIGHGAGMHTAPECNPVHRRYQQERVLGCMRGARMGRANRCPQLRLCRHRLP